MRKTLITSAVLAVLSFSSCSERTRGTGLDINNKEVVLKFLQGKWTSENNSRYDGIHYKIEIVGNKIKVWDHLKGSAWDVSPDCEVEFDLTDVTKYKSGNARFFTNNRFDDVCLAYRNLPEMHLWDYDGELMFIGFQEGWFEYDEGDAPPSKGGDIEAAMKLNGREQADRDATLKNSSSVTNNNTWDEFLVTFKTAIINKDKTKIISMTDEKNFSDGGGGATASEFLNDADISKETGWSNLIHSIKAGVKGKDEKQTVGGYPNLYFVKKNNQWYWQGIVGDLVGKIKSTKN